MSILWQVGYLLSIVVAIGLSLYVLRLCEQRRTQLVARYLIYITFASLGILVSWLGLSLAPTENFAFFWTRFRIVVSMMMPVWFLSWVLHYAGLTQWLKYPRILLVWILPITGAYFSIFDPLNPFFIRSWGIVRYDIINVELLRLSTLQSFALVYYALIGVCAVWVYAYKHRSISDLFNLQMAWILGGLLLGALVTNMLSAGLLPVGTPHPYPIGIIGTGLMVLQGLRLSPLSDVAPIAHELVFKNINECVIVINDNDLIADINPKARNLFPADDDPIGKPIRDYPTLANALTNVQDGGELQIDARFYSVGVRDIPLPRTSARGRVLMLTDITERKMHEMAQERMLSTLDAYARTVAHDLKNPLTSISGYLELAQMTSENQRDENLTRYLERAQDATHTMTKIINSLLLLSTLRDGESVLMRQLNVQAVAAKVLTRLELSIQETNAQIHLPDHLAMALGYPEWVEEVLLNYLSNALKYGGTPPIIHISAQLEPNAPDMIRYNVCDNGAGLSREEQSKLFKQFSRLEKHQNKEGHGLGLVIVRQMVERMGGRVSVVSKEGEGSTFSFSLPTA
jgi:signal transduction histidine kinase/uncharacterized membrane protein YuzA (DUF378 family)